METETLLRIATLGGERPSVYGFPIERRWKMTEEDSIVLTDESGTTVRPDFSIASWHHGPEGFIGGVTLYLPSEPWEEGKQYAVSILRGGKKTHPETRVPRWRWLEDLVGARVVDHDHGPLRWKCERIGPDDPERENEPTFHGERMTRWEAQGWLRDQHGNPVLHGWLTLTTWNGTEAVHVEFHLRNQAPRGAKWGSRLLDRVAFEAFPGWVFGAKSLWMAGYAKPLVTRTTSQRNGITVVEREDFEGTLLEVFRASGDQSFIMAEADGIVIEFVAARDRDDLDQAVEQPFAVLDAWDVSGWGYVDGMVPPPVAWEGAPMPPRLKPLYNETCWAARANDTESSSPDDWYLLPRISVRAEDMWHHRAGAPHRNDLWDVPFLCRPSRDTAVYVDDLHHYAKSFCEMPHQTHLVDPGTRQLARWELEWGQTKDEYPGGRPSIRRNANDPDELSFEGSARRWMLWENPGSNMTLDREHSDLACLEQAWLCSGRPLYRRFLESRHFMTGLLPDGAGVNPASSDRMLAWYLQHHEVAARLSPDPEERKRRVQVGLRCLQVNADLAGQVRQKDQLLPAPTVNGEVPQVMFLTGGDWSGWAGWMVALQWQCGVLPIMRAGMLWGIGDERAAEWRKLIVETASFIASRDTYYDRDALAGYAYKLHPHGEETVPERVGGIQWGEGKGPHVTGYVGEAYHPTEPRVALNGSMSWFVEFWAALARFVPAPWLPAWIWRHCDSVIAPHLEALRSSSSPFHPYRASAWNYLHRGQFLERYARAEWAGSESSPLLVESDPGA